MISMGLRIACLGAMLLTVGCGGDDGEEEHDHGEQPTGSTCPTTGSTLNYQNFGQSFMTNHCTRCHGSGVTGANRQEAPIGINFDTVEGVRAHRARIDSHAAAGPDAINTLMPPSEPRPSEAQRRELGEWLACGAP
jgi:uncharacterized membrane protein